MTDKKDSELDWKTKKVDFKIGKSEAQKLGLAITQMEIQKEIFEKEKQTLIANAGVLNAKIQEEVAKIEEYKERRKLVVSVIEGKDDEIFKMEEAIKKKKEDYKRLVNETLGNAEYGDLKLNLKKDE